MESRAKTPLKATNVDRSHRKGVVSATYEEFVKLCVEKFNWEGVDEGDITVVLDTDGTEIDKDYYATLSPNTVLMVLRSGESWSEVTSAQVDPSGSSRCPDIQGHSRMMEVVQSIRDKQARSRTSTITTRNKITVTVGWQHYSFNRQKYILMKSSPRHPGVGPRPMSLNRDLDYDATLKALTDTFFPNGRSIKGRLYKMTTRVGNAGGRPINCTDITTLGDYSSHCGTQKPRLYLLTKQEWSADAFPMSSDSDSDLPDIAMKNAETSSTSSEVSVLSPEARSPSTPAINPSPVISSPSMAGTPSTTLTTSAQMGIDLNQSPPVMQFPQHYSMQSPANPETISSPYRQAGTPTVSFRGFRNVCPVCLARERDTFMEPCGHTICSPCGSQVQQFQQHCSTCRGDIKAIHRMYP